MSRLPSPITECLCRVSSPDVKPHDLARAVSGLLDLERRLGEFSLSVESFREMVRSLGLLDEARNVDEIYEAWSKLSCFFLEPIRARGKAFGFDSELADSPVDFEAVGGRWERTLPELEAFLREEEGIEHALVASPGGGNGLFKLRTRFLLLDRRAERIKVGLDLLRRDLLSAARQGVERITTLDRAESSTCRVGSNRCENH